MRLRVHSSTRRRSTIALARCRVSAQLLLLRLELECLESRTCECIIYPPAEHPAG